MSTRGFAPRVLSRYELRHLLELRKAVCRFSSRFGGCSAAAALMLVANACAPQAPSAVAPVAPLQIEQPAAPRPAPKPPQIDAAHLHEILAYLADDARGGRYSLDVASIRASADYLAERFAELARSSGGMLRPVGDDYRVPFVLREGVELTGTPELVVTRSGKRDIRVDPDAFEPIAASGGGTVQAPVVFVGYGLRSSDGSYDDVAGVDLDGKIALVLLEAPGQPDMAALYRALLREANHHREVVEGVDARRKARLVSQTSKRLAAIVGPHLHEPLPRELASPKAEDFDARTHAARLLEHVRQRPGPRFAREDTRLASKLERLVLAGAKGVIVVQGPRTFVNATDKGDDRLLQRVDPRRATPAVPIPVVHLRWKEAHRLLQSPQWSLERAQTEIDRTMQSASRELDGLTVHLSLPLRSLEHHVPNVLAYIPGREHPDEIVMLGAHYDHIGRAEPALGRCKAIGDDTICNGADDNASGTAVIMEAAAAIARAGFVPSRTIVFALFAGEELGLLGSEALASQPPAAPPFAGGRVVAMINVDMVGRLREQGLAIGGIGSSDDWMPLLERLDKRGLTVTYDPSTTSRSDHASYYRKGVPVLFFFTHLHDDYHAAGDELQRINIDGLNRIAGLVLDTLLATTEAKSLQFRPASEDEGLTPTLPKAAPTLGSVPSDPHHDAPNGASSGPPSTSRSGSASKSAPAAPPAGVAGELR